MPNYSSVVILIQMSTDNPSWKSVVLESSDKDY